MWKTVSYWFLHSGSYTDKIIWKLFMFTFTLKDGGGLVTSISSIDLLADIDDWD